MQAANTMSLFIAGVFLINAGSASGQPVFGHTESIESTVANADLIFIAKIIKLGDMEQLDRHIVQNTTITIEETLKDDLFTIDRYERMQMPMRREEAVLSDWKERGSRLLIAYDGFARYATTVIELKPRDMEILRADFTLLRSSDAVIRAARETLERMPRRIKRIHTFDRWVPRELIAKTNWRDECDDLILSVPVDEQLERAAIESIRSKSYQQREEGVRALRYFRSSENISRVRTLLEDPEWAYLYHAQENKGVEVRIYGVRQEAYRTLRSWGVEVVMPMIREEVKMAPR